MISEHRPIFAVIECHRHALDALVIASRQKDAANDAQPWLDAICAAHNANDAVDSALLDLTTIAPTTIAGVAALVDYYAEMECDTDGSVGGWQMHDDDKPYGYHLARNVARALERIAV